jgi:hypothetical protein
MFFFFPSRSMRGARMARVLLFTLAVSFGVAATARADAPTVTALQKQIDELKAQQGRALISTDGKAPVPCDAGHAGTLLLARAANAVETLCVCTFAHEWSDTATGKACFR